MKKADSTTLCLICNLTAWLIFSAFAAAVILHFISLWLIRIPLILAAALGLAYFEQWVFSRFVNKAVEHFMSGRK